MPTQFFAHYRDAEAGWDHARWPNFKPQELASKREGELLIDEEALDKLQALRTRLGRPLILTSAYRSAAHNRAVGGAANSQHLLGKAFDVRMTNQDPAQFERAAREVGFTSFGFYERNQFIHIDTRATPAQWGERWYDPAAQSAPLPVEPEYVPERPSEDRDLIGSVVSGGGGVAGGMAALSAIGDMHPAAQVAAMVAIILCLGAAAYVFRRRIKRWTR